MTDLIAREATTVPGLINLLGAVALLGARSAGSPLDRLAIWLLVFGMRGSRKLKRKDAKRFWGLARSVLPPPLSNGELACVALIFLAYNAACAVIVKSL